MSDFLTLLVTKGRKGPDTASAGTLVIPDTGDRFDITGTTGITVIDTGVKGVGSRFYLRFTDILTITHDDSALILNGGTDITTAANDVILFEVIGTNQVQQVTPYGVAGPKGDTGDAGATGETGATGAAGADGSPLPRVTTTTSSGTPTPDADTTDLFILTALAESAAFAAVSGTPASGQKLMIQILDNGTAQTLSWDASYVARGAALPSTTVIGKWMYIGFIYNATTSTFDCVAMSQEA